MKRLPYIVKEKHFIHSLHQKRKRPAALKKMIKNASQNQMRAIHEIVGNSVQNPHLVRLTSPHLQRIKRKGHHKYFREFLNKKTPLTRKKRLLNQKGNGILSTVFKVAAPLLTNLLGGSSNNFEPQQQAPPPPRYYYPPPPPPDYYRRPEKE